MLDKWQITIYLAQGLILTEVLEDLLWLGSASVKEKLIKVLKEVGTREIEVEIIYRHTRVQG